MAMPVAPRFAPTLQAARRRPQPHHPATICRPTGRHRPV